MTVNTNVAAADASSSIQFCHTWVHVGVSELRKTAAQVPVSISNRYPVKI